MKTMKLLVILVFLACAVPPSESAEANSEEREREIRDRYEKVLLRNPFQERAFNQVYESFLKYEGIDAWIKKLEPATQGDDALGALLLQGQIYDRQFKSREAIAAFEKAAEKGEKRGAFKVLLGTLYYKVGSDDKAAKLLTEALDDLADLDQRSNVCRILGNLYLRQGKRDEAIGVWKRIADANPKEIFSQLELAEIYEDNRMWDEAISVYRKIADLSEGDAYRKCRALRSIGQALIQAEKFKEAITTFEQALELVAPGNWLFEDIKMRLVSVYEDIGDLEGLTKYLAAKLEQTPGDLEFRDLLAETWMRMAKFDLAEKEYRGMLERNPRSSGIYEKLIALYSRTDKKDQAAASYEKLIELYPNDSDYLRRLGEVYLRDGKLEKAKETWERWTKGKESPERLAETASWYEEFEFPDEAIAAYEKAAQTKKNKDWVFRLASLKFQKGDETNAIVLWTSVVDETSKPEEITEVASILESHQKFAEAGPLRKQAVEKAPESLEFRLALARNLMTRDKFEEALKEFELLAGQSTNEYFSVQGETGRLDAFRELGILEEKQKEWEKELDASPNSPQLLGKLARLYERAGQREKAIQLYERRRAVEPDNVDFARALAGVYKSAKQIDLAVELLKGLIEKDKTRARVYYKDLLDLYLGLDLRNEAVEAAEKIVSLAPSDPEARLDLAQVYMMYQQQEKGLQEYRHVLRLESNEPDYYRQYGDALAQEKKWGEAQEAYRKMLEAAREDTTRLSAVRNLARIYLQQDQLDDLLAEFGRRVRNTPKKLAAHEELSVIYNEAGQMPKSVEALENALQLVDDKESALKSLIRTSYEAQDFPKVRTYFEQLIATSGKPSAFDFEKLGSIYAQMGEIEKARETWNKIVEINPKDPKLANQLAEVLKREGFTDEAVAAKARAVELDPFNFKSRYDYAQLLASSQQFVQALEELRKILEIGDREEQKKEAGKEKSVSHLARGQIRSPVSPYQFLYGLRSYGQYMGGGWQGSYKAFRPNVVMLMASLARQSIGEENFVKELEEQVAKNKENTELKRDLVAVYQMYNRVEDALKLAEELLKAAPNDVDLTQQLALYYASQQQPAKAITLLERLMETQPRFKLQAIQGLTPLYFQNKQEDKALELVDKVIQDNPTDIQVIFVMASLLQNQGKGDKARSLYELAAKVEPRYRQNTLASVANSYKAEGKMPEALSAYKELLMSPEPSYGGYVPNKRMAAIYVPTPGNQQGGIRYSSGVLGNFPQNVIGYIDWAKGQALTEMKQAAASGQGNTNDWQEFENFVMSYQKGASQTEQARIWNAAKLLIAFYLSDHQNEKAEKILNHYKENGMEDIEWYNLANYLAELKEDYTAMASLYEELEKKFPGKAREIAVARATTWTMAKNYQEAAKIIRQMNQERIPPGQITAMIQPLVAAGEKKLARELLEEHVATSSRNSAALAMLARLYSEDNEFDKAITLANEAWKRQVQNRSNNNWMYGYSYGYYSPGQSGPGSLLRDLHSFYVAAGKSDQLIAEFKDRLEKQPGSVQAHENLAELYRLNNDREKALEVYETLAGKRPHLQQTRKLIASLYSEKGDFKKATEIYEKLLKDYPSFYQQLSWELRYLYQRIGKGKDLDKIEQGMADKARDPNQIRQLADRFKQSGDIEKAAELYEKAIKLSPQDSYMKAQLADVYVEQGKIDEAVKLYREHLDSPMRRAQGYVDSYTLQKIAGLFKAAGKLQELKDRCDSELKKNPNDMNSKCLQAHIAILEKRFPDALEYYEKAIKEGRDSNALYQLMELAEITGDVPRILEIIDKNPNQQQYWDLQRVAKSFQAQGNDEKAKQYLRKWSEQQIQNGGGGYEYYEVIRVFVETGYWDLAEEFAEKHRRTIVDDYAKQEVDNHIVRGYVNSGRFTNIVESIISRDKVGGRDLELLQKLLRQYQDTKEQDKRRAVLEKVAANDPKNREIAFELAETYGQDRNQEKRAEILERLVSEDPNNQAYRERLSDALIQLGRREEALDRLEKWTAEKPMEQRYRLLSQLQAKTGLLKEARQSLVKARDVADSTRKLDLNVELARFDENQGETGALKKALLEKFTTRKDAGSFSEYLSHLKNSGRDQEAYEFFVAEKDGFLDRYRGNDFLDLCFGKGDLKTPLEISWQFLRYSERYNRDYYFRPVRDFFQNNGKSGVLLADLKNRITAEQKANKQLLIRLAQSYQESGFPEKAVEVYTQILAENPYEQEAPVALASLLTKLKRGDEAITLLRNRKPPQNLQTEITQTVQLIQTGFQTKHAAESEKEIQDLLSWAKGGQPLVQLAEIYFEQKNYEKALGLFEQSDRLHRDYNRTQVLMRMAQCEAKTGQFPKAAAIYENLMELGNSWNMESLVNWCVEENELPAAIHFMETDLKKRPNNIDTWVKLARLHKSNDGVGAVIPVLVRGAAAMSDRAANDFARSAATLINEFSLMDAAVEEAGKTSSSWLKTACLAAVPGYKDSGGLKGLGSKMAGWDCDDMGINLGAAEAFSKAGAGEPAGRLFTRVLSDSKNESEQLRAARGLIQSGQNEKAIAFLKEQLAKKPFVILGDQDSFKAVAESRNEELIGQLAAAGDTSAFNEGQKNYYRFLINYYSGKKEEAGRLAGDLAGATLTTSQLLTIANLLKEGMAPEVRQAILERIAAGGYGFSQKYEALSELAGIYAKAGDLKKAVKAYADLFPQWTMNKSAKALFAIAGTITQANYPQLREAVVASVKENPGRDANSQLLGILAEIAEKVKKSESISALCAEAGVEGLERAEAGAWTGLVQSWEISPVFSFAKSSDVFDPETEYLKKEQGGTHWKKLNPEDVLGIVHVQPALDLKDGELAQKVVYARTEIESPEDQTVTLTAGSDDWLKIWVNGEEVLSSMRNRGIALDQERFRVDLKKGKNTVLLKCGNNSEAWSFCLRRTAEGETPLVTASK